jgi:hypothetical protein
MNDHKENKTAAQAGIEDFNGISQEQLRGIVREGLQVMFAQEVNALCGEFYSQSESVYRGLGSEVDIL